MLSLPINLRTQRLNKLNIFECVKWNNYHQKAIPKQTGKEQDASNAKTDKIEALIAALVDKLTNPIERQITPNTNALTAAKKGNFWLHIVEIALITVYAFVTVLEWRTFDKREDNDGNRIGRNLDSSECRMNVHGLGWTLPGLTMPYNADHVGMYVHLVNSGKTPAFIDKAEVVVSRAKF